MTHKALTSIAFVSKVFYNIVMDIVPYGERIGNSLAFNSPTELEMPPNLTDAEKVRDAYDQLGLDDLLRKFAFGEPLTADALDVDDEDIVDQTLFKYTLATTFIATRGATTEPDMQLIRDSLDHVYNGMDAAIEAKLNPTSFLKGLLAKVGMVDNTPRHHIAPLDNHFWSTQLPAELQNQTYIKREPDESEAWYLARGIYHTMHTRVFSHFSNSQQATRFAS